MIGVEAASGSSGPGFKWEVIFGSNKKVLLHRAKVGAKNCNSFIRCLQYSDDIIIVARVVPGGTYQTDECGPVILPNCYSLSAYCEGSDSYFNAWAVYETMGSGGYITRIGI